MKDDKIDIKKLASKYFYERPRLVNRSRCKTYNPLNGCLYCGNETFRYYSSAYGKRYYQCEKCKGINH